MSKDLLKYWRNPDDGANKPIMYLKPKAWLRSVHLYNIIKSLIPPAGNPTILEIGSNIGRNLVTLRFGDYLKLSGIELSEIAIKQMYRYFPITCQFNIHVGEVEKLIYLMKTDHFDITFTMAVLEHIPPESFHIFKQIVRITKQYLITIEDEKCISWRHFPRKYDSVFKPFGLKQIKVIKKIDGLSKNFVGRIFIKEIENLVS